MAAACHEFTCGNGWNPMHTAVAPPSVAQNLRLYQELASALMHAPSNFTVFLLPPIRRT